MPDQIDYYFRTPTDLTRSGDNVERVLIVGACVVSLTANYWKDLYNSKSEFVHINSIAQLDNLNPRDYDFQLTSIPFNNVMHYSTYWNASYDDSAGAMVRFEESVEKMRFLVEGALRFAKESQLPTFVSNFLVPQQNPIGRLLPRYDLRNPVYYVEKLNEELARVLDECDHAYLIDADSIAATYGKRYLQDDAIWNLSHGGIVTDLDFSVFEQRRHSGNQRLEPIRSIYEDMRLETHNFWGAIVAETISAYRILQQKDSAKVVIVDLDDTLWRGVIAEEDNLDYEFLLEGLHLGVIEALLFLKMRGVLLAISSKNDHEKVSLIWKKLFGPEFGMDVFFTTKINWKSKADNIDEILKEANVLSRNAVFLDDNPRERDEVLQRFPEIRVLGSDPYSIRRVLLWSSETQVAAISNESGRRTEMVRQQIVRENEKRGKTREEFLQEQSIRMSSIKIDTAKHWAFSRSLELINKTNQFNTTGIRWTAHDLEASFSRGGTIYSFEIEDRFSRYGIVISALTEDGSIKIFTMSCRVIGFEAEIEALRIICLDLAKDGNPVISAISVDTDANLLSRDLFPRAGFAMEDDKWTIHLDKHQPSIQHHILVNAL